MPQAYFLFLIEFKLLCISVLLREKASHFSIHFFASSGGVYFWIITKNTTCYFTQKQNDSFLLLSDLHHLFLCKQRQTTCSLFMIRKKVTIFISL